MKKLNDILIALILISTVSLLSEFTNINFRDLFVSLYANEQSDVSEFIVLKKINTKISSEEPIVFIVDSAGTTVREIFMVDKSTSIYIRKDTKIKIGRDGSSQFDKIREKIREYNFQFYNSHNNTITLENKKTGLTSVSVDDLASISIRVDQLRYDNELGGVAGALAGGAIGAVPSAFVGFWALIILDSMSDHYSDVPGLTCMGITAAGTLASAKLGYDLGKNMGNPYIHIPLSGENAWEISSE